MQILLHKQNYDKAWKMWYNIFHKHQLEVFKKWHITLIWKHVIVRLCMNGFQYLEHLKFRSHEQFMMIIFSSQKNKVPCENCKHHPYISIVKCSKGDEK